ncbi:MAG: formylglycine-generating enzyme family protein [Elusimicrobia bacterium]|nr:formylglycine-generating enzyme family protein [Elusimicrobiota bacterium]
MKQSGIMLAVFMLPCVAFAAEGNPAAAAKKERQPADMALISAGQFMMGSPDGVGSDSEHPRHKVNLDAFYIDKHLVTVAQYRKFARATHRKMCQQPPYSAGNHPVVYVVWDDADAYCRWARKRLPTEAQWEKAARAGTATRWSFGDDARRLGEYAWYDGNSDQKTHPVGQKKPNQYGLYDMQGNVWVWTADWYDKNYYHNSPEKNPKGPLTGKERALRGGAWNNPPDNVRAASRGRTTPNLRYAAFGLRCAR